MRRFVPLLLGTLLLAFVLPGAVAAKPPTTTPVTVPITGSSTAGDTLAGTFEITSFARQGDELVAIGDLTGTLTTVAGTTTAVSETLALPVAITGTCAILDLTLGPLDLDLLGLVIHLDVVHLTIDAESGPGNLLGNLLCAIVGLLDGPGGPLGAIAALLNRILSILQTIPLPL
jgi:hypothetical protein